MKKIMVFIIFIMILTTTLYSEDKAGRVIFFKGKVEFSTDNVKWNNVKLLQYLSDGTCVRVEKNGEAALILKDRSQIRLSGGSLFCLKKSGSAPGSVSFKQGLLNLKKGSLWFRNKRKTKKPLIETPVITASIRGTEMLVNVDENKKTEVVVLEGKVKCANDKNSAVITRGEMIKVNKEKKITLIKLIRPENRAQWLLITPDIVGPADKNDTGKTLEGLNLAKEAMKLLVMNKSNDALKKVREAVNIAPDSAAVNVAMATILQSLGKFGEAMIFAEKSAKTDKLSLPALLRNTELYLGTDKIEDAENLMKNFKGNKNDARFYLMKGYLALVKLETNDAISYFKQSISLSPDFSEAYLGLGLAEYYNGKIKDGLKHMEYASVLNPFAAYPHYYLGKAIYGIGEIKNAEIEFKRAVQLDSNDPTSYLYLATVYADNYKPGDGILALQKAIELNNNKLATRSRFLLDQDRAAKNISLAWSLSMMGLDNWAKYTGDEAVWDNPADSGVYLFRASQAVGKKAVDAATLGDIRRARLLQPVNSNTFVTYTDYQGLLEKPKTNGVVTLTGGTDKTFNGSAFVNSGKKNLALYAEGSYNTTDGPKNGTGEWGENGLFRAKYALNENHQLLFEGILGHRHDEDLDVWSNGNAVPEDVLDRENYWSIYTGYHWRQANGNHLLSALQYSGGDGNWNYNQETIYTLNKKYLLNYHRRTFRGELLEMLNFEKHKISVGSSVQYGYMDKDSSLYWYSNGNIKTKSYRREYKIYIKDIWSLSKNTILDYGFAFCRQEGYWLKGNGSYEDKDRFLPVIGLIEKLGKNSFRFGFFQELQPDYLSGTIEPVEVAGFKQISGVSPGTWTKFYGAGWDRQWNNRNFTKVEILRYERRQPIYFNPNSYVNVFWRDERDTMLKLVYETLLTKELSLSLNSTLREIKSRKIKTRRTDKDFGVKLTYVHDSGIIAQGAFWYVDQDTGLGYNDNGDSFGILSFSIQKSLFKKKGLIYFNWENITDIEYKYLAFEPVESLQLPWQNSRVMFGIQWNF